MTPERSTGTKHVPKYKRVLRAFVEGKSMNRFEAARELRDSCLNSTVSELQLLGVKIHRKSEVVPGAFGPVYCSRYWINAETLDVARKLLGMRTAAESAEAARLAAANAAGIDVAEAAR